jgi:diguanylate cyclase (GGDEF)-like protein
MDRREKTIMSNLSVRPPATRSRGILTVTSGPDVGRVISLPGDRAATLGRSDECTFRFDDASVSGKHAIVIGVAGSYIFEDAGSTNGSYLNDVKALRATPLGDGDRVRLGTGTMLRFSLVDEQEELALKKVYEAALKDGLTGALNRRALEERIDAEVSYANRHGSELSLMIFDVDHFKRVNDTFGHPGGDAVLRSMGELARRSLRTEDTFGRYGGEEFVVITRGIDLAGARGVAERLRELVAATPVPFDGREIRVTASAGVASLVCCGASRDRTTLVSLADARLYRAKQDGRNRVVSD